MTLLPLHVDGINIKDSADNTIRLRGSNGGGLGDTCTGFFLTTLNEATVRANFAAMQSWGANCIRIMLSIRWWLENSKEVYYGTTEVCNRPYRQNVLETIQIAEEYGLYVIVSFWSIDTNYAYGSRSPSTQDYLPYPPYASTQNFATIRDKDDFIEVWAGDSGTSSFLARFQAVDTPAVTSPYVNNSGASPPSISEALSGYDNVIYELYNEPSGHDANWSGVTAEVIDAIRALGDNHPIMVQCGYCGSFYAWADIMDAEVTGKTHVVFSNHIYRSDGSFPGDPYTYAGLYNTLITSATNPPGFGLAYVLNTLGYPVVIGEIGCGTSAEERSYFQNTLLILNEQGCGFCAW